MPLRCASCVVNKSANVCSWNWKARYINLYKHYEAQGFALRTHDNTGRCASNALSLNAEQNVIDFIRNFADYNVMPLPGKFQNAHNEGLYGNDVTK